jgi:hypothetical protein
VTGGELRTRLAFEAMGLASRARLRTAGWRHNDRLDRWPGHAYYPPSSMHLTVLNLDPYVAAGQGGGVEVALIERAADVLGRHGRFRVTLRGLNVSPWTVFAQAYSADAQVAGLRASLRGAFREQADAPRRDSRLRRALPLVLANAVRFMGPVDPAVFGALRPWRDHTFEPFEVHEVQVVRTDGMSPSRTEILEKVRLDAGP